jgi:ribonuclease HII
MNLNLQEISVQPFKYDNTYIIDKTRFYYILSGELKWLDPDQAKMILEKAKSNNIVKTIRDNIILNIEKIFFEDYTNDREMNIEDFQNIRIQKYDKKFEDPKSKFNKTVNDLAEKHLADPKSIIAQINKIEVNNPHMNIDDASLILLDRLVDYNIIGIDEAGKGPVIGSMFISGVSYNKRKLDINVKDSKLLSDNKRKNLYDSIKNNSDYNSFTVEVESDEIDNKNINKLTRINIVKIIRNLKKENSRNIVFIDCPIEDSDLYSRRISRKFLDKNLLVISENNADKNFDIVSAASIIAKQNRENYVSTINDSYDNFEIGSGYPSDEKTRNFIENYYKENSEFPKEVRKSWSTCDKILEDTN